MTIEIDLIQITESELIKLACGSECKLFTNMMHRTRKWVDLRKVNEKPHISPFKVELDKQVDLAAYYIECGYNTEVAVKMIGKNYCSFRHVLTNTHNDIISAARKQRIKNKEKNYKPNKLKTRCKLTAQFTL